ncbi:MAG: PIN domain-containing protein [Euryarchaeota archaeon]|nr:PIN domain-containing protein [Euryarchaeota archaeon]
MAVAAIDTGVWVEYINTGGKYHAQATAVIDRVKNNDLKSILPQVTPTEIYYVSRRVYEKILGKGKAQQLAAKFYEFIYHHPNVEVYEIDYQLGLRAGEIKYEYGIALSDCYLLALSEQERVSAIFRHREEEFSLKLEENFKLVFLEDYV